MTDSLRGEVLSYAKKKYNAEPEYLWMRYPDYAVLRHSDNGKWFGIIMNVGRKKLGLDGDEAVDIMNVKIADPLLLDLLVKQPGYFRAYHMSKTGWISVLLDGSVPFEEICRWIDESCRATASAKKKQKLRPPKEWIVPANPKYYDIERAFDEADEIDWKQGAGIKAGDTVYMYVAAPVSAILYKCLVTKTDIPFEYESPELTIRALMRIKLQKRYEPDRFTFEKLGSEHGIFAVRGPRGIPASLSRTLNEED